MSTPWVPEYAFWFQLLLTLAMGTVLVAALALAITRRASSAVWQRTVWQTALIGLAGLVLIEAMGAGEAICSLLRPIVPFEIPRTPESLALNGDQAGVISTPSRPTAEPASDVPLSGGAVPEESIAPEEMAELELVPAEIALPLETWRPEETVAVDPPAEWEQQVRMIAPIKESDSVAVVPHTQDNREADGLVASPVASWSLASRARWPGWIWLAGSFVVALRTAWVHVLLCRFGWRQRRTVDDALRARVDGLARRLGLCRPVRVIESPGLGVPAVFGILHPTLALPASFAADFDAQEQQSMLAHELAHLAGRDPAWRLAADLVCAALWWHPLAWWSRSRLRAASEAAADEASLLVPGGPDALAGCLVTLGRKLVNARRLGWLSIEGAGFRSGLGRRVERLLSLRAGTCRAPTRRRLIVARAALALALVVVSVFSTAWARPQAPVEEGETTMSVVRMSWKRSLAAMALAAWLAPVSAGAAEDKPRDVPRDRPPQVERDVPHAPPPKHDVKREQIDMPPAPTLFMRELEPKVRELMQKRQALEAHKRELEQRLTNLREDQAEEWQNTAREIRKVQMELGGILKELPPALREETRVRMIGPERQIDRVTIRHPDGKVEMSPGPVTSHVTVIPNPEERDRQNKRIAELHDKIAELAKAGKAKEIEEVVRELAELHKKAATTTVTQIVRSARPMPPLDPQERERRMSHVRAAAEKLREAGLNDQADRLLREAEALLSGKFPVAVFLQHTPGMPLGGPASKIAVPGPKVEIEPNQRVPEENSRVLREQMRDLQEQMKQLRADLQSLRGEGRDRPRDGKGPDADLRRPERPGEPPRDRPERDRRY